MAESLSPDQARKLVLLSQRLPPPKQKGTAQGASLAALEHLGYVQIDTISVIERAHHHTFWTRNPRYQPEHLDQLIADRSAFEYWSHAAAYLPMRDFRFSLPRKLAIKSEEQDHWYQRDHKMMNYVLERIRDEGPLMAKDFDQGAKTSHPWHRKPAKQALEYLFHQGDLMITARKGFHKIYDLTERVIPDEVDQTIPDLEEYARFLITRFLEVHGLAQEPDFSHLLKANIKQAIKQLLPKMLEEGELQKILVADQCYFALPDTLDLLNKPLSRRKAKILSPFDNLVIQRQRMRDLFGFDYQIECYVPAAKRKFGYFSLPVLWDGRLVARMDCKAERKTAVFRVHRLDLEPGLKRIAAFREALDSELTEFARFNGCQRIEMPF